MKEGDRKGGREKGRKTQRKKKWGRREKWREREKEAGVIILAYSCLTQGFFLLPHWMIPAQGLGPINEYQLNDQMKSFSIQAISHAGGGLRVSDCILLTLELLLQKSSLTPKVLIPTERLMGYSQTCHPGCVIIPTDSNLPTVAITSCVIIHRLLTLSFHSRIRSRFYLYINKIPSEGFFFFFSLQCLF